MTGVLIDLSTGKYTQNLTLDTYQEKVAPGASVTLAYEVFPFASTQAPANYQMLLAVYYADQQYEYTEVVYRQPVQLLATEEVSILGSIMSLLLSGVVLFLIGFTLYVKVEERLNRGKEIRKVVK